MIKQVSNDSIFSSYHYSFSRGKDFFSEYARENKPLYDLYKRIYNIAYPWIAKINFSFSKIGVAYPLFFVGYVIAYIHDVMFASKYDSIEKRFKKEIEEIGQQIKKRIMSDSRGIDYKINGIYKNSLVEEAKKRVLEKHKKEIDKPLSNVDKERKTQSTLEDIIQRDIFDRIEKAFGENKIRLLQFFDFLHQGAFSNHIFHINDVLLEKTKLANLNYTVLQDASSTTEIIIDLSKRRITLKKGFILGKIQNDLTEVGKIDFSADMDFDSHMKMDVSLQLLENEDRKNIEEVYRAINCLDEFQKRHQDASLLV